MPQSGSRNEHPPEPALAAPPQEPAHMSRINYCEENCGHGGVDNDSESGQGEGKGWFPRKYEKWHLRGSSTNNWPLIPTLSLQLCRPNLPWMGWGASGRPRGPENELYLYDYTPRITLGPQAATLVSSHGINTSDCSLFISIRKPKNQSQNNRKTSRPGYVQLQLNNKKDSPIKMGKY